MLTVILVVAVKLLSLPSSWIFICAHNHQCANSCMGSKMRIYTYDEVVERGARGLGINNLENLQFVVSGGVVKNTPYENGEEWTLGVVC